VLITSKLSDAVVLPKPPRRDSGRSRVEISASSGGRWCIEGLRALDQDVCYVLSPLADARPRRLLVVVAVPHVR
jgi:hypothetical protein